MAMRVALLLCLVTTCSAVNYPVVWKVSLDNDTLSVKCDDTITLSWTAGTHDVNKLATNNCSAPFTNVVDAGTSGTYKYNVTKTETFYLACKQFQHCQNGQVLQVIATCSNTTANTTTNATKPATTNSTKTNTTTTNATTNTTKKASGDIATAHTGLGPIVIAVFLALAGVWLV